MEEKGIFQIIISDEYCSYKYQLFPEGGNKNSLNDIVKALFKITKDCIKDKGEFIQAFGKKKVLLFNLFNSDGSLYAQERWTYFDESEAAEYDRTKGYKIEIRYFEKGNFQKHFVEAIPQRTHNRELVTQE